MSDSSLSRSAETTSTPLSRSSLAFALDVLRVMARILYRPDFRAASRTEPPWTPVAPTIVRIGAI